jgi:hypothetical protein
VLGNTLLPYDGALCVTELMCDEIYFLKLKKEMEGDLISNSCIILRQNYICFLNTR